MGGLYESREREKKLGERLQNESHIYKPESSDAHCDDNKTFPDKKHKRMVKTPSQVEALEKFYDEHRYPTEAMKSELAKSLGLTEKQISGWFCHRRLKDKKLLNGEVYLGGRQERSSVVIQDRGSGLRQDSCGSTKQGDFANSDLKEVESRRFTSEHISAADLTNELGSNYTVNCSDMNDTSSEGDSPLHDEASPKDVNLFDVASSGHPRKSGNIVPTGLRVVKPRNGPSGYLKVKGQVENAAITAVKRQLGKHYREDSPPLGVEFDPLPPGAFESSITELVNEHSYLSEPVQPCPLDVSTIQKHPKNDMRYDGYYSKIRTHNFDGTRFKTRHGSDIYETYPDPRQFKRKSPLSNPSGSLPLWNSSVEMNADSAREMSAYDRRGKYVMRPKHVAGMRLDSVPSHHMHLHGRKATIEQRDLLLGNHDGVNLNDAQHEHFESTPSYSMLHQGDSFEKDDRGLSRRMAKEDKYCRERTEKNNDHWNPVRVKIHPKNGMRVAKRVRNESPSQEGLRKAPMEELDSWTDQFRRFSTETPCSFSEDESAETSSSGD